MSKKIKKMDIKEFSGRRLHFSFLGIYLQHI